MSRNYPLRSLPGLSVILLAALLLLSACGTTVNVDYDQAFGFGALKTYTLQAEPMKTADDPRIDSPLMYQRLRAAIQAELNKKGYAAKDTGANFEVFYRLDVKQEIATDRSSVTLGAGTFSRSVGIGVGFGFPISDVESQDRVTLTIDIHANGKLIWRGSDDRRLYKGSTPESNTKLVNELVSDILKRFPPK